MKIMFGVSHPKHVHFFKNVMVDLIKKGHELKIVAWDKDITLHLLDKYDFNYEIIGPNYNGIAKKAYGLIKNDIRAYIIAKKFDPDLIVGGSPYLAHVSKLIGKTHMGFTDTENANLTNKLSFPFSDVICTPSCYKGNIDPKKHIAYNGFEELAYLHPIYFKPDASVLDFLGLNRNDKFIVMRFVAWEASHDIGDKGIINKVELIQSLEKYAHIFISSEKTMPTAFEKYRIKIPPEKIHDLMYYSDLFIGESASMACESAILGTPAIFVSTSRRGYTDELEFNYDMLYTYSDPKNGQESALNKALELMMDKDTNKKWHEKRKKLFKQKIDVTEFITDFIERYPESFIYKNM